MGEREKTEEGKKECNTKTEIKGEGRWSREQTWGEG